MNHFKYRLSMLALMLFGLMLLTVPIKTAAFYNSKIHVVNATADSITADWTLGLTDAVKERLQNTIYKGYTDWELKTVKVAYKVDNDENSLEYKAIDKPAMQYTFTGLLPDTAYSLGVECTVILKAENKYNMETSIRLTVSDACTTSVIGEARLLGTTGTTATVDYGQGIEDFCNLLEEKGYHVAQNQYICVGYADQAEGKDVAVKKAREMAGKQTYQLGSTHDRYTFRGLSTDHTYTFCIKYDLRYFNSDYKSTSCASKYFEISDVKVTGEDDSEEYQKVEPVNRYDWSVDEEGQYVKRIGEMFSSIGFTYTSTDTSITIDWSEQKDASAVFLPALHETKVLLACVEEQQYDPYADIAQYGKKYNYGPNIRAAIRKADQRQIALDPSVKSYTFTGLKPATYYSIVIKCGYQSSSGSYPTLHICRANTPTAGALSIEEQRRYTEENLVGGYMYEPQLRRNGAIADINFKQALNDFFSQTVLDGKYAGLDPDSYFPKSTSAIGYAKLPDTYSKEAVEACYKEARDMAMYGHRGNVGVEYPYTNGKVYELDPDAKYVFAVAFGFRWFDYGNKTTPYEHDVLYIDETGVNYYKAKAMNVPYDGHQVSDDSGESGSGSSSSGGSGSGGSSSGGSSSGSSTGGSTEESGSGNSSSGDSGSGSSQGSSTGNGSATGSEAAQVIPLPVPQVVPQPVPQTVAGNDADSKSIRINKQKKDNAWITADKDKIALSDVKKKAQTVTLKIENSTGKITAKDISKVKIRNNVKIKVKGRKIILTFKKGSPKGNYKFDVTVGASKGIKKTRETVKIKVK